MLGKLECDNTDSSHPIFKFLRDKTPPGLLGKMMLWNFSKFLCDANGVPLKRYAPTASPLSIEKDIQAVIDGHIPVEDAPVQAPVAAANAESSGGGEAATEKKEI